MARSDVSHLQALGAGPLPAERVLEVIVLDTKTPLEIELRTAELIAHCPVTGQRDHYEAEITFVAKATLETKALKRYLASWEQEGLLAEDLANSLADDIAAVLGVHLVSLAVTLRQGVRGGIQITVTARRAGGAP